MPFLLQNCERGSERMAKCRPPGICQALELVVYTKEGEDEAAGDVSVRDIPLGWRNKLAVYGEDRKYVVGDGLEAGRVRVTEGIVRLLGAPDEDLWGISWARSELVMGAEGLQHGPYDGLVMAFHELEAPMRLSRARVDWPWKTRKYPPPNRLSTAHSPPAVEPGDRRHSLLSPPVILCGFPRVAGTGAYELGGEFTSRQIFMVLCNKDPTGFITDLLDRFDSHAAPVPESTVSADLTGSYHAFVSRELSHRFTRTSKPHSERTNPGFSMWDLCFFLRSSQPLIRDDKRKPPRLDGAVILRRGFAKFYPQRHMTCAVHEDQEGPRRPRRRRRAAPPERAQRRPVLRDRTGPRPSYKEHSDENRRKFQSDDSAESSEIYHEDFYTGDFTIHCVRQPSAAPTVYKNVPSQENAALPTGPACPENVLAGD
ncbi:hypothetical protein BDK51DRAFT_28496 [Blyttiomyces helicus]|uniref:Uncharacterized protein n=1 Tax=Blyttiomyces helicus TaxID=388810 RepID=A0A4P9WHH1_9FUNG|nr:hypothetical protein BDK51DRAFT_28496 [Blyttiomyces helicus]|eukprot:RKO92281.1 hypothetical protein BDK51DRAFT_28496 [Blyttiomyces helicus]